MPLSHGSSGAEDIEENISRQRRKVNLTADYADGAEEGKEVGNDLSLFNTAMAAPIIVSVVSSWSVRCLPRMTLISRTIRRCLNWFPIRAIRVIRG
jgi:hypothetical protein